MRKKFRKHSNNVVQADAGDYAPQTYISEQKSLLEKVKQVHNDNFVRSDGWMNVLTGLGVCGRDKKQNAFFRIGQIFNRSELDQMYRSDGLLRLIIDIFAQEMIRQGWEVEGDSDGLIIG